MQSRVHGTAQAFELTGKRNMWSALDKCRAINCTACLSIFRIVPGFYILDVNGVVIK
jgi:hypothetical protein